MERIKVQHHHAHVAALMAESGLDGSKPVIGFCFDGTGYGPDGAIWGGEVLIADYKRSLRAAHLAYVPLAGGDAAVKHPARMALAHLWAAGVPWHKRLPPVAYTTSIERGVIGRQLERGFNAVPTSSMGRLFDAVAAQQAGVCVVAGDTKVVDKGHGDGLYINTSGMGLIPEGVHIGPNLARPGDMVIVSGEIGLHGIAIMSVREGLEFKSVIESDCAPLNGMVATMLEVTADIHVLRDPTRGGVASALNEIAQASEIGIVIQERALPVPQTVHSACELLGLDRLYVANEGKLIAIVPKEKAEQLLETMRRHPYGRQATIIGEGTEQHPGMVVAKTGLGATRVVDMQIGEQLPRIC